MKGSQEILEIFLKTNPDQPPYNHGLRIHHKWFKDFWCSRVCRTFNGRYL